VGSWSLWRTILGHQGTYEQAVIPAKAEMTNKDLFRASPGMGNLVTLRRIRVRQKQDPNPLPRISNAAESPPPSRGGLGGDGVDVATTNCAHPSSRRSEELEPLRPPIEAVESISRTDRAAT
jgi:hypothetical protein